MSASPALGPRCTAVGGRPLRTELFLSSMPSGAFTRGVGANPSPPLGPPVLWTCVCPCVLGSGELTHNTWLRRQKSAQQHKAWSTS